MVSRATEEVADPVIGEFLSFLENDMLVNPKNIQPLSASSKAHVDKWERLIDEV